MISAVLLACLLVGYAGLHYLWSLKERKPNATVLFMMLGAGLPIMYLYEPSFWLRMGLRAMAVILVLAAIPARGIARAGDRPLAGLHLPLCLTMATLAVVASLN